MTDERFGIVLELRSCVEVLDEPRHVSSWLTSWDGYLLMFTDRAEAERTAEQMRSLPNVALTVVKLVNGRVGDRWGVQRVAYECMPDLPPTMQWVERRGGGWLAFETEAEAAAEAQRRELEESSMPRLGTATYHAKRLPDPANLATE